MQSDEGKPSILLAESDTEGKAMPKTSARVEYTENGLLTSREARALRAAWAKAWKRYEKAIAPFWKRYMKEKRAAWAEYQKAERKTEGV